MDGFPRIGFGCFIFSEWMDWISKREWIYYQVIKQVISSIWFRTRLGWVLPSGLGKVRLPFYR